VRDAARWAAWAESDRVSRRAPREQGCSLTAIVHDAVVGSEGSGQLSDGTVITTGSGIGELARDGSFLSMTGLSGKTLTALA
jgi:hypothetical protein